MILEGLRFYEPIPTDEWPFYLPPIRHIAQHGLRFTKPITFIVGENGSGKSTLVEAIARAYGLDERGGHGGRRYAPVREVNNKLSDKLRLDLTSTGYRTKSRNAQGFFLRSETAKGMFEYMSDAGVPGYGERRIAEVSHGEGYIQVLSGRFNRLGLYLLDEPEAALSFTSSLALMEQLTATANNGSQIICATHSPILAALPGAEILEFIEDGISSKQWQDLQLVQHWQRYMGNPETYLRDMRVQKPYS